MSYATTAEAVGHLPLTLLRTPMLSKLRDRASIADLG